MSENQPRADQSTPMLELRSVYKRFGAIHAANDVSFSLNAGEVVALLGDNGAGKSTICKIISGAYSKDAGEMLWNGDLVEIKSPDDAARIGIAMMYQDLALLEHVDVPGNVYLGQEPSRKILGIIPVLDFKKMKQDTKELLDRVKIRIPDLDVPVAQLSGGQRQATGVARILQNRNASLLIMDEPMAALGIQEERKVIELIKNLRDSGFAILVVSHNLDHVFSVSDRIIVLSTGKVSGILDAKDATHEQIVGLMMGGVLK
jgi:simple sugar transport system ATP-binding protein